ncbi:reverse transcriptase domain-containing protein [Tanacetum coccineum]
MHNTMVPEQVKTQKIQAGVQVSRLKDKDGIFSIGSALEDFILLYFILVRNIVHSGKITQVEGIGTILLAHPRWMEKWAMLVTCHMFVYVLNDPARVWWYNLQKGVVTNYEDLKRRFRTYFSQQKRQTKTHLASIKRREWERVRAFITPYTDETSQITRLNEDQRIACFVHGVVKLLVKFISTWLPESYDGYMEKTYTWIQAEDTDSEGRPIVLMNNNHTDKIQKERSWEGSEKKGQA